jgi:hypothetical protein
MHFSEGVIIELMPLLNPLGVATYKPRSNTNPIQARNVVQYLESIQYQETSWIQSDPIRLDYCFQKVGLSVPDPDQVQLRGQRAPFFWRRGCTASFWIHVIVSAKRKKSH